MALDRRYLDQFLDDMVDQLGEEWLLIGGAYEVQDRRDQLRRVLTEDIA